MKPGIYNLTVYQGTTFKQKFEFFSDLAKTTPIDLTGSTIRAQIRQNYADASPLATFTVTNRDDTNGIFYLELTDSVTAALSITTGFWDLEIVDTASVVNRYLKGSYTLDLEVTK